jgi:hypothetical protein
MSGALIKGKAKVLARLPPNEPVLTAQGVPAMSWLYFFQLLGRSADEVIAADLPALVDQMLLDLVPLTVAVPVADVLAPLAIPLAAVEGLPELSRPALPIPDVLEPTSPTAAQSRLAQRITDLELWSL